MMTSCLAVQECHGRPWGTVSLVDLDARERGLWRRGIESYSKKKQKHFSSPSAPFCYNLSGGCGIKTITTIGAMPYMDLDLERTS